MRLTSRVTSSSIKLLYWIGTLYAESSDYFALQSADEAPPEAVGGRFCFFGASKTLSLSLLHPSLEKKIKKNHSRKKKDNCNLTSEWISSPDIQRLVG